MNEITHTLKKGIFFSLWFYQFFIVECIAGYYGIECKSKCVGHCKDNKQCNHVNGTCDDGCKVGYTGSNCTEGCWIFLFLQSMCLDIKNNSFFVKKNLNAYRYLVGKKIIKRLLF